MFLPIRLLPYYLDSSTNSYLLRDRFHREPLGLRAKRFPDTRGKRTEFAIYRFVLHLFAHHIVFLNGGLILIIFKLS